MEDISPAVERALASAKQQAGEAELNALHLFAALIEDEDSRAACLLVEAQGDLARLREGLQKTPATVFDLAAALTGAREVAGERAETTITGEYLLLGLIRSCTALHAPLRAAGVALSGLLAPVDLPTLATTETLQVRDPSELLSAGRIVDVNANRAAEALRVLDDYCRFVLEDGLLTAEVKYLRHELANLLSYLPPELRYQARDTQHDVGTTITSGTEMVRGSVHEVARINGKRLQESLRSLEEYGKLLSGNVAAGFEKIRYRSYTLERTLLVGVNARERLADAKLYALLTGANCLASLEWTIQEAAAGGVKMFQLREKTLSDRELLERAKNVRRWTRDTETLFIMNDRPDLARLAEADGVHLGQDDLPLAAARKILGAEAIIGVSTHNLDQVREAVFAGASYIGVGPIFNSTTKQFNELAGLEFLHAATQLTTLPTFAIGGISPSTVEKAVAAGAKRLAVSAAICRAEEPRLVAHTLVRALPD